MIGKQLMVVHIQARLHLIRLGFTHQDPSHSYFPFCPPPECPLPAIVWLGAVRSNKIQLYNILNHSDLSNLQCKLMACFFLKNIEILQLISLNTNRESKYILFNCTETTFFVIAVYSKIIYIVYKKKSPLKRWVTSDFTTEERNITIITQPRVFNLKLGFSVTGCSLQSRITPTFTLYVLAGESIQVYYCISG